MLGMPRTFGIRAACAGVQHAAYPWLFRNILTARSPRRKCGHCKPWEYLSDEHIENAQSAVAGTEAQALIAYFQNQTRHARLWRKYVNTTLFSLLSLTLALAR